MYTHAVCMLSHFSRVWLFVTPLTVRLFCPLNSPGKNTGVACHALLQRIFPTQGSNSGLPHYRWILYCLSHTIKKIYGGGLVAKSCPTLATPWTIPCQCPLTMGFSGKEYWSGLLFPSPGGLPNPGIEPVSPTLAGGYFPTEPPG